MKYTYLVMLFTCMSLILGACGKSSSNVDDNSNKEICTDGFDRFECDDVFAEADDFGFRDTFRNPESDCECELDENKVIYRGLIRCETVVRPKRVSSREVNVYVRKRTNFRRNRDRKEIFVDFSSQNVTIHNPNTEVQSRTLNCGRPENDGYSVACRRDRDCRGLNQNDFMRGSMTIGRSYCRFDGRSRYGFCSN